MHWALVNGQGHCEGIVMLEGGDGTPPEVGDGVRAQAVTLSESIALRSMGHHAVLQPGDRWGILPASHGRKIDRSRGLRADFAMTWSQHKASTLDALERCGALEAVDLLDEGDVYLPVVPATPWYAPTLPMAPETFIGQVIEIRPGLVVRFMLEREVDDLAKLMLASGAWDGMTLQECWTLAHTWWSSSNVWALALDWAEHGELPGRVLQYEMIHFDDKRSTARAGFMTHVSRERPSWFWRECSKRLFEQLMYLGYTRLSSQVRPDRKDYADSLTEGYGAENLGLINGFWSLRYDLATMVASAPGWRAPETARTGWTPEPGISVREGYGDADIEAALTRVREAWYGRPRGVYADEMLRERLALDAGTLLLGYVGDELRTVWVMRWKAEGVVNWAVATPWDPSAENGKLYREATRWCASAGFTTIQVYLTGSQWDHVAMATQRLRMGWAETGRVSNDAGTFIDAMADIASLLTRPTDAWTAI